MIITQFMIRCDDGPTVTASKQGSAWNFAWKGGGGLLPNLTFDEAEKVAEGLAERLREIAPLRDELEERNRDLGEWLEAQREMQ